MLEKGYEYDDVLIQPRPSSVNSRDDVDISVMFGNFKLKFPLIASPMKDVVDVPFLQKLSDLGGLGILHRFYENSGILNHVKQLEGYNYGVAVGLNSTLYQRILEREPIILLIDVANGYTESLLRYCEDVKGFIVRNNINTLLMAGNVVDYYGSKNLVEAGVDIVRCGIGGGSNCSTRNITGISIPSITAIQQCSSVENTENTQFGDSFYYYKVVADGGIKNSGDFVKSIVAGAHFCMSGRLFAETYESPAENVIYGMASRTLQDKMNMKVKSVEGFDTPIKKKYSLEQFVSEFGYGIKSAGTYLDAKNLDEIRSNGKFIKITGNAIKKL